MVDKCQLVQLAAELRIKLKKELPKGKLEQTIYSLGIQIRNMKMVFNIYGTWRVG